MKIFTTILLGLAFVLSAAPAADATVRHTSFTFCARPVAGGPLHCWTR